jgi:signal recognition particle subunit SRP54
MVLENLGNSLKNTFDKIKSSIFVDEKLINELVRDIQRALLSADVNVKLVFDLTNSIKQRALKEEVPGSLTKKEYLVKIVYDELVKFLGEEEAEIKIEGKPFKIMLVGLFGNGKTTTTGKLCKFYSKRGYKVAAISTDTWRPAAYTQLKQIGDSIGVQVFGKPELKDPVKIYKEFEEELNKFDIVIIDTAGRDALNEELVEELNQINQNIKADETLLVLGADVGQAAQKQAETFHKLCDVNGVIITKLDGTAKGGGSLSACSVTGAKVKFIGLGEKVDDLEKFKPKNFVGRLLGMGDLEALLEKAKDAISEEDAKDMGNKFLKGEFSLLDLYEQMKAVSKMGSLSKVMGLIPGMSQMNIPKEMLKGQEHKITKWKFIMDSCTKTELENADILDRGRIERVSQGSGVSSGEIKDLLKQYKQSKKMVKMLKGGNEKNMEKMMSRMGGMKGLKGMGLK